MGWNGGRVDRLHVQDTALISGYSNDSGLSTHDEKKSLVLSCSFFLHYLGPKTHVKHFLSTFFLNICTNLHGNVVVTAEKVDGVHVRICPMSRFAPTKFFHKKSKKINYKNSCSFLHYLAPKTYFKPFFCYIFFLKHL